ncbi:MAG: GTP cyclohydrolase I FolE, partial [Thermodesulfobacteriota bacterium]
MQQNNMKISYIQLIEDSKELAKKITTNSYTGVYGIPNGGILPAYIIAEELDIPLIDKLEDGALVVDDLIDSGKTINSLNGKGIDVAVLYRKPHSPTTKYHLKEIDEWIDLPHEGVGEKAVEHNIIRLLEYIGEDPNREGLKKTPERVVRSYKEIYGGYKKDPKEILTVFQGENYDQMIMLKEIEFFSTCEHHMLPFFGKAHVAYVPQEKDGKVVGISKLARMVEIYSRRLQNQERLTKQIGDAIQ